jgi:FimV-like protein
MPRLPRTVLLLMAIASTATAATGELWEQPWIEVRSPHFVIVSALAEQRTIELASELEGFRAGAQAVTNVGRIEVRIPTTVYVLPYRVEKLGFQKQIAGFFMPRMRANYAAVIPVSGRLDEALKHEYVHFLVRNRDGVSYPPWLDEGFAEVLQTMATRGRTIEYGRPIRERYEWLYNAQWMPFARLLEVRDVAGLDRTDTAMFYAQSWLLMHYLMAGRRDRSFDVDQQAFLDRLEDGASPAEAFEQAFGLPVMQIRYTLTRYGRGKLRPIRARLTHALAEVSTRAQPVGADSIAAQMGSLLLLRGERDEAKRYWDAALAMNPNNGAALAGLGDIYKLAGRFDEARPYYERAIAAEPQNAYHELDYGEYFLARARAASETAATASDLATARLHFARSYELDPNNPETLAMNGASYLFNGEPLHKALESLTVAYEMLPSQPGIKLLLAQAYAESGERAAATQLLRSLVAWSHVETADEARRLLDRLNAAEPLPNDAAPSLADPAE